MDAKVSVIIPAYNAERTIIRCMNSVKRQSYSNIEVIIIDDGSKDCTKSVIEEYIQNNDLDWIFISRVNKGVSFTRNQGIKLASGDYVAFLDSDDYWYDEKITKQIEFCKKYHAKVVGTFTNAKQPQKNEKHYYKYSLKDMLYSNRLYTSTVLIAKEVFNAIGIFHENMSYAEDYNLWLRMALNYTIFVLNEELVYYEVDYNSGLSSKLWEMEKGELYNLRCLKKGKHLSNSQYMFFVCFSLAKCVRRVLNSKKAKKN